MDNREGGFDCTDVFRGKVNCEDSLYPETWRSADITYRSYAVSCDRVRAASVVRKQRDE